MRTRIQYLNEQINILTEQIKNELPDVYRNINEMPVTIPNTVEDNDKVNLLEEYLQSLQTILETHKG